MRPELAIVVPVYNEEANILPLARELAAVFHDHPGGYEIVFVDDASQDETWEQIAEARRLNPHVRALQHEVNAGQSAALWTGLQATDSPLIATIDGDLQNDPADLPRMLAELQHCDFVCGVRWQRHDNWVRRVSSRAARKARKWVLGVDFSDTGCAARVFKRSILGGIFPFNGWHRFLPVLVYATGARTKEVPVNHRPRVAGISKYGLSNRLWRGIYDLFAIAWYQKRRLRAVAYHEATPAKA